VITAASSERISPKDSRLTTRQSGAVCDQVHRTRIDVEMFERHVRIILRDANHCLSPELRSLEHVCFIDEVTLPRRLRAASNATRATRSISSTE
jgi:hypothetical protein